jgi:hypothetical protein
MSKFLYDGLAFVIMACFLSAMVVVDLSKLFPTFSMIPLIIAYYSGQAVQRKFQTDTHE